MKLPNLEEETPLVVEYLTSNIPRKELAEKNNMTERAYRSRIESQRVFLPLEPSTIADGNAILEWCGDVVEPDKVLKGGKSGISRYPLRVFGADSLIKDMYENKLMTLTEMISDDRLMSIPFLTENAVRNFTKQSKLTRRFKTDDDKKHFQDKLLNEQEATMVEKYGVRNAMHSEMLAGSHRSSRGISPKRTTEYVPSYEYWLSIRDDKDKIEGVLKDYMEATGKTRLHTGEVADVLGLGNTSLSGSGILDYGYDFVIANGRYRQDAILEYVTSQSSEEPLSETRPDFMNGLELDVYVPALKVAFEYNGSYYHSDVSKDNNYHQNKTELARKAGVSLMHIWEYDWVNPGKQDILKSQIAYKLHSKDIKHYYARKLELKEVSSKEHRDFMNENHIQGAVNASVRYGLYNNEELLAVMSFSKTHKVRSEEYELKRFATKKYTSVAGGMSKLLKHFIKEHGTDLMSYANNDFAHEHASYEQLGFTKTGTTVPGYKWIRSDEVVSRQKVQVAKLKSDNIPFKQKAGWEDGDTEVSFMTKNGFHKVYDAGNDIYVYNG